MELDASKALIRAELSARIREALELRDWIQLEHWSKQWIQLEPKQPNGFKWLARASVAQKQLSRAAYAYGRLLDFEADNDEARQFFIQYPSTLAKQPNKIAQNIRSVGTEKPTAAASEVMSPEQRQQLAELEFNLAEGYSKARLFSDAAIHYRKSFGWRPSQAAALGVARGLQASKQAFEATKFLREQLYHFPDWIEGRILLGKILFEIGHRSDAQREWQLALEQDPKNEQALSFMRLLMAGAR